MSAGISFRYMGSSSPFLHCTASRWHEASIWRWYIFSILYSTSLSLARHSGHLIWVEYSSHYVTIAALPTAIIVCSSLFSCVRTTYGSNSKHWYTISFSLAEGGGKRCSECGYGCQCLGCRCVRLHTGAVWTP